MQNTTSTATVRPIIGDSSHSVELEDGRTVDASMRRGLEPIGGRVIFRRMLGTVIGHEEHFDGVHVIVEWENGVTGTKHNGNVYTVDAVHAAPGTPGTDWDRLELQAEGLGEDAGLVARADYVETTGERPEHAADSFTFEPPAPLSGEWADGDTPDSVMRMLGVDPYAADSEDVSALCDAYEDAFFRAFYAAH